MMSQRYAKWGLNSCDAVTRADRPTFLPRGDLRTPIVRGDDVVCGEEMEVRRWLGNILRYMGATGSILPANRRAR